MSHLGVVFLRINGEQHCLWWAVDQHGVVLDILVQGRRNATAARHFFKRLLRSLQYKPRRIVTDGLRSYGVAHRDVLPEASCLATISHALRRLARAVAQKDSLRAAEQDRPSVAARRRLWRSWQPFMDPERFVFVDETGAATNMIRRYGWALRLGAMVGHRAASV